MIFLFGRRERDIPVGRELPAAAAPRELCIGDVVRDRLFPLAIERVASFEAHRVRFESGDFCFLSVLAVGYEHADGAPIEVHP